MWRDGRYMDHIYRPVCDLLLGPQVPECAATAVIVGALLVGDSMRGSLRGLTIERLGNTESAIFPGGFFEVDGLTKANLNPIALMLFENGIVEFRGDDDAIRRAGAVQIIGCNSDLRQYQIPQSHQSEIHLVHGRISALSVFEIAEKRASREYPEL